MIFLKSYLIFFLIISLSVSGDQISYQNHLFIKIPNDTVYISKYEISNIDFVKFLNESSKNGYVRFDSTSSYIVGYYKGDSYYKNGEKIIYKINDKFPIFYKNDHFDVVDSQKNFPVTNVSWYGAFKYCDYYGLELPSEKNWLNASKGTNSQMKKVSEVKDSKQCLDSTENNVCNLNSNVSEWIYNFYEDKSPYKQIRGSSYKTFLKHYDKKMGTYATHLLDDVGFRPIYNPDLNDK